MRRGVSLTLRLTLFFTGLAATVVLGLGWLFMSAADRHFVELDRAALHDKRHLIEEVLASATTAQQAQTRLQEALSHHHGLFAQVRDAQGAVLFQSSGFVAPVPVSKAPEFGLARTPDGREVRVLHFAIQPSQADEAALRATLTMDTAHHAHFLADLARRLTLYAVLATVFSGVLGWLAARQGLAPLRSMKARAAGVSAHQLSARMAVDAVPVEMAELATELNGMLDRLQSDFNRLQDFASDLAHELRTPISNLLTQTQVTLANPREGATYRDTLASNAEELQRLARMVSDMLLLAKTERGVDLPHKECFAVAPEVQALCAFYEALADEKRIALHAQGDATLDGDRLMFRRALSNLLSNALRHTPEGGTVWICTTQTDSGTEVAVENTGSDIDPQALPRLFDRFYRADPARTHVSTDGAGLGLPITQAIVQAHGGQVTVASQGGRTRFGLVFPKPLDEK